MVRRRWITALEAARGAVDAQFGVRRHEAEDAAAAARAAEERRLCDALLAAEEKAAEGFDHNWARTS